MKQKGGMEGLVKVPKFKYTLNDKRILFISTIYPYADYFFDLIIKIPFNTYTFKGEVEYYSEYDDKTININCSSTGNPTYIFFGGCAYELLNKYYKNLDLYKYADPTGDIDVKILPPKITSYEDEANIIFIDKSTGKINAFYSDFTTWIFNKFLSNINSMKVLLNKISSNFVEFDILEYDEIPNENKTPDKGYKIEKIDKFYVVGFLTENIFKIQIVCKISENNISVIDHMVEILIPTATPGNDEFDPSFTGYKQKNIQQISISGNTYNIDNFNSLIDDNIVSYLSRKNVYGQINENEYIHKSLNHVARLLYLYELFYIYKSSIKTNNLNLIILYAKKKKEIEQLQLLHYYKIVDNMFHKIKINMQYFLNAYHSILETNKYAYKMFTINNPNYFINNVPENELHDNFIIKLFDSDLFESTQGVLTFSNIPGVGGKGKKYKSKKNKIKKKNKKKTKKNKLNKRRNKSR